MGTEKVPRNEKKKVYKTIFFTIGVVALLFVGLLGYGVYWAYFDMNRLPTGEYLTEESSPDGKVSIR
ncbi:hypothetical protein HMPREF9372_0055 [Sporosarcina newyorkensis 2681]|uniref:Uncharacterized protein n=1 Tax=Sporosarcina newyorkensis 2681 TaxID=1027292 RepID=F9DMM5_9BACL|nr:hypothetical protein HMPREF9372_0055 [Sporosarcina newyorkensis 2681]